MIKKYFCIVTKQEFDMKKEKEETKQGCKKSRKRLRHTKTRKQRKYDDLFTLNDNFDFIGNWSNSYQIG